MVYHIERDRAAGFGVDVRLSIDFYIGMVCAFLTHDMHL
jgi:hypothetical protein